MGTPGYNALGQPVGQSVGAAPPFARPAVTPGTPAPAPAPPPPPKSTQVPFATQTPGFNGNGATPTYGTQSPSMFGTGQYVAPLFPINDQAITGAPTQGAGQDYGLNGVWGNLSKELAAAPGQGAGMVRAATAGPASYTAATGTAAQAQAAQGGYATSGPVGISTAGDAAWQQQQGQLAAQLATTAAGGGVSPADLQLARGGDANVAHQLAILGSQRGSTNAALAQRSAADQGMAQDAATNAQMGLQRAQETQAAQQALGNVLGTARGQAQAYNANQAQIDQQTALANASNAQQTALANTGYSQQAALANMGAANAMTSGNLAALNAANVGNAQLSQQATMANVGATNAAELANQGAQLSNAQLYDQELNAITGAQSGIANSDKAAALADQQLQLQQMIAANQVNEQGYASAAQANGNLTGSIISGVASLAGTGLQALGKSGAANSDPNGLNTLFATQGTAPDPAANLDYGETLTPYSDENLKTGIEGGNPMMRSYLSAYRDSMSRSAPRIDVAEGSSFRNPTFAKKPSSDGAGSGIGSGIGSLIGGVVGSAIAPGVGTMIGAGVGGAVGKGVGGAIGGGGSGGGTVMTSPGSGVTVDESGWGQMPTDAGAPADDGGVAISDDREKDAVTSGNRGMQAFLQQANAQTGAQNGQGARSNAFMQTGEAPSNQVDRQLPPNLGGYGAQQPPFAMQPQMQGFGGEGSVYGGGVSSPGGYTPGAMEHLGWLGNGPGAQMTTSAVAPQAVGGTTAHAYPGLGGIQTAPSAPAVMSSQAFPGLPTGIFTGQPAPQRVIPLQLMPRPSSPAASAFPGISTQAISDEREKTKVTAGAWRPATAHDDAAMAEQGVIPVVGAPATTAGGWRPATAHDNAAIAEQGVLPVVGAPAVAPAGWRPMSPADQAAYAEQLRQQAAPAPPFVPAPPPAPVAPKGTPQQMQAMLDQLHAYQYRYKNPSAPGAAPGVRLGVMAQDLEKSPLGSQFVFEDPDGHKRVDYGQALGTMMAGQAMLNDRLNDHDAMLRSMKGGR